MPFIIRRPEEINAIRYDFFLILLRSHNDNMGEYVKITMESVRLVT